MLQFYLPRVGLIEAYYFEITSLYFSITLSSSGIDSLLPIVLTDKAPVIFENRSAFLKSNPFANEYTKAPWNISPAPVETKYDYDALIEEFNNFVAPFMQKNPQYYAPRIVSIVEKYLGKGKKVSDTTIDQAEFIYLILGELKEEIK